MRGWGGSTSSPGARSGDLFAAWAGGERVLVVLDLGAPAPSPEEARQLLALGARVIVAGAAAPLALDLVPHGGEAAGALAARALAEGARSALREDLYLRPTRVPAGDAWIPLDLEEAARALALDAAVVEAHRADPPAERSLERALAALPVGARPAARAALGAHVRLSARDAAEALALAAGPAPEAPRPSVTWTLPLLRLAHRAGVRGATRPGDVVLSGETLAVARKKVLLARLARDAADRLGSEIDPAMGARWRRRYGFERGEDLRAFLDAHGIDAAAWAEALEDLAAVAALETAWSEAIDRALDAHVAVQAARRWR